NQIRIGKRFGQRPLERIVPEIGRETAAGLFDRRGTAKNTLADADGRWIAVEEIYRDRAREIFQAIDQVAEFPVKMLNDLAVDFFSHRLHGCTRIHLERRSVSSITVPKLRPAKLKPLCTYPLAPTRAPREGTPLRVATHISPVP